jgi:hypothetical protein
MSKGNLSDEECNENIIEENNKITIDKIVKSKPFKVANESTIISMKNIFQSGKTSLINKNNIAHKGKPESNNSSLDEEIIENLKE